MSPERFHKLFLEPEVADNEDVSEIEILTNQYPWFQAAHALLLKIYLHQESFKYKQNLKNIALITGDRQNLYNWLHIKCVHPVKYSSKPLDELKHFETNINQVSSAELRKYENLKLKKHDIEKILGQKGLLLFDFDMEESKDSIKAQTGLDDYVLNKNQIQTEIETTSDQLTDDTKKWLEENIQLSKKKILKDTSSTTKNTDLIDKFILKVENKNKTSSINTDNQADLSDIDNQDVSDIMTETMAKIYMKQELFEKALAVYHKLSLKYPEKNSYFASQIQKIERIINNK